jgi:DNA-binding NarL/FixJ family response regulator
MDVLRVMAGPYINREIAEASMVSEGVVKNHVLRVLSWLGARDPTRAVPEGTGLGYG